MSMIFSSRRIILPALVLMFGSLPASAQTILESDGFNNPLFGKEFVEDNGRIWFSALNSVEGGELWLTDGTFAGTLVAGESTPGNDVDLPIETVATGDKAFFLVDGDQDWELWMTDGTQAGTQRISENAVPAFADKNPAINGLAIIDGVALAFAQSWLFAIDPATGDTTHLRPADGAGFVGADDFVYAFSSHPTTFADELIRTDGTVAGTSVLANITFEDDDQIGIVGNQLIFFADDFSGIGEEIFVSDGTLGGTGFLPEMLAGDEDLACADIQPGDGVVYVGLRLPDLINCRPYQTDGTSAGTVPVVDTTGFQIYGMSEAAGYVFYWESAVNLWRTDGTVDGTIKLATLDGTSTPVIEFEGAAWFAGFVGAGYTLWRSDGTIVGTEQVFVNPAATLDPLSLAVIGNRLYFSAFNTYFIEATGTAIDDVPQVTRLKVSAYPNPFVDHMTVEIVASPEELAHGTTVTVYDLLGRRLLHRELPPAAHNKTIRLLLDDAAPGIYIMHVRSGNRGEIRKIVRM